MKSPIRSAGALSLLLGLAIPSLHAADKKIVLIAGKPSHPPGMHEFRAGCLLLSSALNKVPGVVSIVHSNGWPTVENTFDGADAVVIYADGGGGHPAIQGDHGKVLGALAKKGVGLGFMHYGVEVPADKGGPEFLDWIGGYYETLVSVNPMWSPDFQTFPVHAITRGVKPFTNRDEWYFNIHFREGLFGYNESKEPVAKTTSFQPLLVAKPSDEVRKGPYVHPRGPYDHIVAASGRHEMMMWAVERADGGRGFGFTGGHTHAHWSNDNQRKIVLNALLWIAKTDVPADGVESTVTEKMMEENLDPKMRRQQ